MKIKSQTYAIVDNATGQVVETSITRESAREIKRDCERWNAGEKFSIIQYIANKKVR